MRRQRASQAAVLAPCCHSAWMGIATRSWGFLPCWSTRRCLSARAGGWIEERIPLAWSPACSTGEARQLTSQAGQLMGNMRQIVSHTGEGQGVQRVGGSGWYEQYQPVWMKAPRCRPSGACALRIVSRARSTAREIRWRARSRSSENARRRPPRPVDRASSASIARTSSSMRARSTSLPDCSAMLRSAASCRRRAT